MGIVAKYKFNQTVYENFIPTFNSAFTSYTVTDEIDTDGYTIRTISSDSLPTLMIFGTTTQTDKEKSLLEVYKCNTEKVTTMQNMFYNCSSLTSLDLSNWDTSHVTNMDSMFYNCSSLTSLDVSSFNTENVSNMVHMFNGCSSLTSLDVSSFNTKKVANINGMFANCSSLTSLDVSNFNTEKVTNMSGVFHNCSSLTSLDVSNFNTEEVTDMSYMFRNCSSLTFLDVSNLNTEKVTNVHVMFQYCYDLINVGAIYCNSDTINKISDLITTNTSIYYMDAKLEDLTKKSNITYKEYKMNILESDEEINLRRIGDVYDELNLETGELTQRIEEVTFNSSSGWIINDSTFNTIYEFKYPLQRKGKNGIIISNNFTQGHEGDYERVNIYTHSDTTHLFLCIDKSKLSSNSINKLNDYLQSNPITVQYQLTTPVIKTINLKSKPSIDWQGDIYLHLENNTLYPQLDCEVESINYYEIPKLKANTLYTLRYVGEPTQCIFGGLTYRTENNMILTSGSSDNLLYFDKEVRKVVLIEGDVRDRNFDYFEGIESLGAVEIVTHKTNMPIFAKGGRK